MLLQVGDEQFCIGRGTRRNMAHMAAPGSPKFHGSSLLRAARGELASEEGMGADDEYFEAAVAAAAAAAGGGAGAAAAVAPQITERAKFNYAIVVHTDIKDEDRRREMTEVCQIACEKYSAAEKLPSERDNRLAAKMIKETLDAKMKGPFNVIVGEAFTMDVVHVAESLFYMFFGGYLAVLVWKCV